MLPTVYEDDLTQDFTIDVLPSDTFKMDHASETVRGTIYELEAVKQAVFLILSVERYEWLIYSWEYGAEFKDLIGKPSYLCIPEIEQRISEALLQDDRILKVQDFSFEVNKSKILASFTVVTIFGEFEAEKAVEI